MEKLESRRSKITDRLILTAILLLFATLIMTTVSNCLGQEPDPPGSHGDLLYTIDHYTGLEVLSIIPPATEWVALPILEHARTVLGPEAQAHGFYHVAGTAPVWHVPIPGTSGAQFMRVVADDSALESMFVFRARGRLSPVNPDGTPSNVIIPAVQSWWVVRLPAAFLRMIFNQ